jgi:carboxyl-terminal processing protease
MVRPRYWALLLAGLVTLGAGGTARPTPSDTYQALDLYTEAMTLIHDRYVDPLSWDKIVQDSVRGAVQGLDADSTVLEKGPDGQATAATAGDVGLVLTRRDGGLTVVAALDGMPAQVAGIQSGDRILTLDGDAVATLAPDAAVGRLRGRPGTEVKLTVIRSGWAEPRPFMLTRAKPAPTTASSRGLGDGVLYVRMPRLDQAGVAELTRLLTAKSSEQATGLVLDLRNTVSEQIETVPAIASLFLEPGRVVAHVEGRTHGLPHDLKTVPVATTWKGPVALLVSRGTSSAAEVLAGALQDARRAVIVGSPTFGDASTQSTVPLSDGETLSLTTARYLTPDHHPITGHGVVPDVMAQAQAANTGEQTVAADAKSPKDSELELAFEVVKAAGIIERGAAGASGSTPVESAAQQ